MVEADRSDPLAGDELDPDRALDRRTVLLDVEGYGTVFARVCGNHEDPLVLYVHGRHHAIPYTASMLYHVSDCFVHFRDLRCGC